MKPLWEMPNVAALTRRITITEGRKGRSKVLNYVPSGLQVLRHVATLWVEHGRAHANHVVAGQQRARPGFEDYQVAVRVARGEDETDVHVANSKYFVLGNGPRE